jgi:hypothetical protein
MTRFDSIAISRKEEDLQPNFTDSPSSSHFPLTGTLNLLDQQSDLSHFSKTNSKFFLMSRENRAETANAQKAEAPLFSFNLF